MCFSWTMSAYELYVCMYIVFAIYFICNVPRCDSENLCMLIQPELLLYWVFIERANIFRQNSMFTCRGVVLIVMQPETTHVVDSPWLDLHCVSATWHMLNKTSAIEIPLVTNITAPHIIECQPWYEMELEPGVVKSNRQGEVSIYKRQDLAHTYHVVGPLLTKLICQEGFFQTSLLVEEKQQRKEEHELGAAAGCECNSEIGNIMWREITKCWYRYNRLLQEWRRSRCVWQCLHSGITYR